MNTILTVECVKPLKAPGVGFWNHREPEKSFAGNEVATLTWLYRLMPLPGSAMDYLMDGDGVDSLIDVLISEDMTNDPVAYLHCMMQDIIERKEFAHSEHDAHFIVHLLVSEGYDYDGCENFQIMGVLNLDAMTAK